MRAESTLPQGDCWMTPRQFEEYASIKRDYQERLRRRGEGPPYAKIGHRTVRYRKSDIDKWLESLAAKTEGE